jgi:hypothetical protein
MNFHSPHAFWLLVIPLVLAGFDFMRRRRAARQACAAGKDHR